MPGPSSVIVRQAFTNLSRARVVNRGSRSTPRTASTARPATSRTRPRTSTGSPPKAAEAPITRTCKLLAGAAIAALALVPGTAAAKLAASGDPNRTYVEARAAAMNGDHGRSAALFAAMAESQPSDPDLAKKGLGEALGAGQIDLALRLARSIPAAKLPTDARLLLVADEVRRRRVDRALPWLSVAADNGDLSFLSPVITAWDFAERGDLTRALTTVDTIPVGSLLAPLRDEEKALILLKFRKTADAEPYARRAIGSAGSRETRLRLALADGFLAAGDRARAQIMIEGIDAGAADGRQRIL